MVKWYYHFTSNGWNCNELELSVTCVRYIPFYSYKGVVFKDFCLWSREESWIVYVTLTFEWIFSRCQWDLSTWIPLEIFVTLVACNRDVMIYPKVFISAHFDHNELKSSITIPGIAFPISTGISRVEDVIVMRTVIVLWEKWTEIVEFIIKAIEWWHQYHDHST